MFSKKPDKISLFFIVLIILLIGLNIYIYFPSKHLRVKVKKPTNLPYNSFSINSPIYTRSWGKDPNSRYWKSWGKKINLKDADKKLTFKPKIPKNNNILKSKIKLIRIEGDNYTLANNRKSRVIIIFYNNGIRVKQSNLVSKELPSTNLKSYKNSPYYEQLKKEFKGVVINGAKGLAGPPGPYVNSNGVTEVKPGIVTWYKKPILYTVYGNGKIPLSKLIKIAACFK